jgi:hypothetical protein
MIINTSEFSEKISHKVSKVIGKVRILGDFVRYTSKLLVIKTTINIYNKV